MNHLRIAHDHIGNTPRAYTATETDAVTNIRRRGMNSTYQCARRDTSCSASARVEPAPMSR